jgi:Fungal protein of unknown function (DUF1752)
MNAGLAGSRDNTTSGTNLVLQGVAAIKCFCHTFFTYSSLPDATLSLVMSGADYGERGGEAEALRVPSSLHRPQSTIPSSHASTSNSSLARHSNQDRSDFPPTLKIQDSSNTRRIQDLAGDKLDQSEREVVVGNGLLCNTVFLGWHDDAGGNVVDSPEEMQKKDPLGTQIWKLYSRTKSRLPNQERMENLTWRMMAMNLKRREQRQALYAPFNHGTRSTDAANTEPARERTPPLD